MLPRIRFQLKHVFLIAVPIAIVGSAVSSYYWNLYQEQNRDSELYRQARENRFTIDFADGMAVYVQFDGTLDSYSEKELEYLNDLDGIRMVCLHPSQDDKDLAKLTLLKFESKLDISWTYISSAGMNYIRKNCPNLEYQVGDLGKFKSPKERWEDMDAVGKLE